MGVDYDANYGVGFQIVIDQDVLDEHFNGDHYEFIEELLNDTLYDYFEVGIGNYSGETDDLFVVLKKASIDTVKEDYEKLRAFLQIDGVTVIEEETWLVGGLYVW